MAQTTVLIVDDDKNICMLLKAFLETQGMTVLVCHDGNAALGILDKTQVDAVLLDIMMPGMNGIDTLRLIRSRHTMPVLFLTARDMLSDKVQGFEAGADDYIVKPFEPREVALRIKAQLRGAGQTTDRTVTVGGLAIDMDRYRVSAGGKPVEGLKPREIQLLHFLAKNPGRVFTRDQILNSVWGYTALVDTRTIDVHIKSLRKALGEYGDCITTVFGVGYKMEVKR